MNGINEFKLYWCEPIKITDKIILKTPTLSEIVDLGESNYLELVHTFTATTMDDNIIVSLTDAGIDFNHITNFQLFMLLIGTGIKGADLLFENQTELASIQMFLYMDITQWEPRVNLSPGDIVIDMLDSNTYKVSCTFTTNNYNIPVTASTIISKE